MPVYPGAQDLHLPAVEHARHTKHEAGEALRIAGFLVSGVSGEMRWPLRYTDHRRRVIQFQNKAFILRVD
jgi:hypothetical protein